MRNTKQKLKIKQVPYYSWNSYVKDKTLDKSLKTVQFWQGDIMMTATFDREEAQQMIDEGSAGYISPQAIGVY